MKEELLKKIKDEGISLGITFLVVLIIFKIVFFKQDILSLLKLVSSLYWMFVIPGMFLLFYWEDKIGFLERFIVGILVASSVNGILSYYLGILGLHLKYHGIFLPILIILIGIFVISKKK